MSGSSSSKTHIWIILSLIITGILSYWLSVSAIPKNGEPNSSARERRTRPAESPYDTVGAHRKSNRGNSNSPVAENDNGALKNQRAVVFKDRDAMERFLANLGNGLSVIARIDRLNALLIGYSDINDLNVRLDGTEEVSFNYTIRIPESESPSAQLGAIGLGSGLLQWLGVEGDHSMWGKGVKIAILDTGIADHRVFSQPIKRINLVPLPENSTDLNAHGTTVASLVFSNNPFAPGVAPGATPISIRVANDQGISSSFLIAQGIFAAIDENADLINISLGGQGESTILNSAIAEASQKGIVILASAGNSGREGVNQPAAHPSVIAVGAVDAVNQPLDFSTTGPEIAVSAPGYQINVAYPGDKAAQVSGTSSSTPIVTGVLATVMSNTGAPSASAQQANSTVMRYLNDVSTQGKDNSTGGGVPNIGTIFNASTPGIFDASVNSIYTSKQGNGTLVNVLVQNVGSETLVNTNVSVKVDGATTQANITTLPAGETRVISIPANGNASLNVTGNVQLSGSQTDKRASNDTLSQKIPPAP